MLGGSLGLAATATVAVLSADLPDPSTLNTLTFAQPTVVYDRTGTVQLGTFQQERRRVIAYDQVPKLVLDATTTAEDRTFWDNAGFDPAAILAAAAENASGDSERGASTITQQLVRAPPAGERHGRGRRPLHPQGQGADPVVALTDRFPGEAGKEQIIAAYLNQIFYGHDAYGIAAAAEIYFGVADLSALTPAQAALLAGLPSRPRRSTRTAMPSRTPRAGSSSRRTRRRSSAATTSSRTSRRRAGPSCRDGARAALAEPVVLVGDRPLSLRAPHFTWQVRRQLDAIIGDGPPVETGGYQVITTLNWDAQARPSSG